MIKLTNLLPIINAAIITDLIVIGLVICKQIKSQTLKVWYNTYNLSAILADVLSIVIGIIIALLIYPLFFSTFYLHIFIGIAIVVQVCHDLLFASLFQMIPRNRSRILDTFKDYAKEMGIIILFADASMIVSSILISLFLSTQSFNNNCILLIVLLYLIPYFLYSI
jgi:hypothetical protein